MLEQTEIYGIITLLSNILLPGKVDSVLPQSILNVSIQCIKVLNNVARLDLNCFQKVAVIEGNKERMSNIFNYVLSYSIKKIEESDDIKEFCHETLMCIGYFCLEQKDNQELFNKGETTMLQKLCTLPFNYFFDPLLKEILLPTLIVLCFEQERNTEILYREIHSKLIVDYLSSKLESEEKPKKMEEREEDRIVKLLTTTDELEYEEKERSMNVSHSTNSLISSHDMVSGNSDNTSLYLRFPCKKWKESLDYFQSHIK